MSDASEIISLISKPTKKEIGLINRAHKFSKEAHRDQKRYSGEPFFSHLHETAKNLAKYGMRGEAVAAGLLHDSIEDGVATEDEIEKEFGKEILFLIKGVTKLGKLKYKGLARHAESLRRLFVATSEDIRVLIIKLTDRLHNMQTLQHIPKEKQGRIALETLEIYAPLGYKLGMSRLSKELEDLAFKYTDPEEYKRVSEIIKERTKKGLKDLEKITNSLKKMAKEKIKIINTHYRIKGIKSLHNKLKLKESENSVHDILALRVVVSTVEDCYKTMGVVHGLWRPVPGRIKDYIAFPKNNGYQSLQTTIFTGQGDLVEVQIRTEKMHQEAEYGIAAHSAYKGQKSDSWIQRLLLKDKIQENLDVPKWVKELNNYQKEQTGSQTFVDDLKKDFFGQRIFVFTPNGDVVDLPEGSSPIDFAYAIHSDIGDYLGSVKINGKMSSIETELKDRDIVEIQTKKSLSPTAKWLKIAKTSLAKRRIKIVLREETK